MLVIWKEPMGIPDSSATAAIITATSSPSSTAGAAGAAAGLGAAAAFLAGAGAALPLPSIEPTTLEMTMMTTARMASIMNTTSRPQTATIRASPTESEVLGFRIAFSTLGIDYAPP